MKRIAALCIAISAIASHVGAGVIPIQEWTFPFPSNVVSGAISSDPGAAYTNDASGEKTAVDFTVRRGGAIRRIVVSFRFVTTGDTANVRIESPDANGMPSGSLWAANCNGTMTIASTDDNLLIESNDLTSDCNVSAGDNIRLVIERGAVAGNWGLNINQDALMEYDFTYSSNTTAGWVKNQRPATMFIKYSDGTYEVDNYYHIYGDTNLTNITFNNTSNPNFYGNKITVPFDAKVIGANLFLDADGDSVVNVSNGSQVYLATCTFTTTHRSVTSVNQSRCYFNTSVNVSSGTPFYIFHRPTTSTSATIYTYGANNFSDLALLDGFSVYLSTAQNPSSSASWSTNKRRRVYVLPIFGDISYPDSGAPSCGTRGCGFAY